MPFCANCGAAVDGSFCGKCGSAVGSRPPSATASELADNVASALCYALGLFTGILFLVLAPYNKKPNIKFHAFQSIFAHVAGLIVWYAAGIGFGIVGRIVGYWAIGTLYSILELACACAWLFMMFSTYQGKTIELPVIGPLARQQAGN